MAYRRVTWPNPVRKKLLSFRSSRFTPEETLDFISQFILHTEDLLSNDTISRFYTEESGPFKGMSRVVILGFTVYFEMVEHEVKILAVRFPREN
ncbi:MAG: hypothetical protein A2201_11815 [Alicyclobacillus sp. RIFOXYA1_FULL_53_8]|nr:MAG: hypothetical protein A2201_11815 [Alicyclobacillus sp. RIFOXYA1_FULL_53_8]